MRFFMLIWVLMLAGIGAAMAQESLGPPPAPADVLATMPSKAESVWFGQYPIGPNRQMTLLHIYKVPLTQMDMDMSQGKSRITVDLLVREGGKLKRVNRVTFRDIGVPNSLCEVHVRWLEPNAKRGPVIALHFRFSDNQAWRLLTFPEGIQDTPVLQYFLEGGEGDVGNHISLDRVDRHGKMIVRDGWFFEGEKSEVRYYPWDGAEFADRYHPYFVIAASVKTRKEAETFVQQHKDMEESEIRPSSHYPRLTPGYFIVIVNRADTQKEAEVNANSWRKDGIACYVKRAY